MQQGYSECMQVVAGEVAMHKKEQAIGWGRHLGGAHEIATLEPRLEVQRLGLELMAVWIVRRELLRLHCVRL